ncbi:hypothetical protein [Acinetobacter colistiniresistens]|uniref:hypothetical protein n=1 Tax=Acinetobacter colistiniresistens TaxID=280145 RepID=UPI00124FC6AB|nr:hypothetical protein [Acinetobacter colistiniresistens]
MNKHPVNINLNELARLSMISNAVLGSQKPERTFKALEDVKGLSRHLNEKQWIAKWAFKQELGQYGAVLPTFRKGSKR